MRLLFFGGAALAFAAALCGCGGGSSGASPVPSGSTAPPATPTPDPHPTASGDTFAYAGKLTTSFSRIPSPSASPWTSTDTQSITQNVTANAGASFNGTSGLTDFSSSETDTGQHTTTSVTTDTYVSYVPSSTRAGGTDIVTAGVVSKDSNGVVLSTTMGSGNGLFDELPEIAGAQWTNTAARTESETDPDTQQSTSTYASDGTYSEKFSYPEGGSASIITYADGSGVYQFPLIGQSEYSTLTISAPSGGNVNGEFTLVLPPVPSTTLFTVPEWYPSTPPQAASDTFVDEGLASIPSSCGAAAAYAAPVAMKIVENRQRLDVILGQLETYTQTSYVNSNFGVVCVTTHDDLESYYDFTGQGPKALFVFGSKPIQSSIIDETLGLQTERLAAGRARRTSAAVIATRATALAAQARSRFARSIYTKLQMRAHQ